MKEFGGCGCFLIALIAAVAIVFAPFITIWCINTLWGMSNPYDFWHWLAALLIEAGAFSGISGLSGKRKE